MDTDFNTVENCLVVVPKSRLDTNNSPEVAEKITKMIEEGERRIIFDFSNTDYISSAGLRVILVVAKLLGPVKGKVALCNANDQICEVLDISGFDSIATHFDSFNAAAEFVGG